MKPKIIAILMRETDGKYSKYEPYALRGEDGSTLLFEHIDWATPLQFTSIDGDEFLITKVGYAWNIQPVSKPDAPLFMCGLES